MHIYIYVYIHIEIAINYITYFEVGGFKYDFDHRPGNCFKEFHGNVLKLNASRVEPQTVNWRNCANTDLVATGQSETVTDIDWDPQRIGSSGWIPKFRLGISDVGGREFPRNPRIGDPTFSWPGEPQL